MRVCVVGAGRMGLPVAVQMAGGGADVVACDLDDRVVASVAAGRPLFDDEPGLAEAMAEVVARGRLRGSQDTTGSVRDADAVVVLVRMATTSDGRPDYRNLDAATAAIGAGLRRGAVVCYETTVPVGDTRRRFAPALEQASGMRSGTDFHVCFSPERVSSGSVFAGLLRYPKIVGGLTPECAEAGRRLYVEHLGGADVWVLSSCEAAELTKVAETTYRDVNIALANEFARFADECGVDLGEVIGAANSQPYSHIHTPGIGVGGHCIPVYPHFFMARASDARLVRMARQINEEMPAYAVTRLHSLLGPLEGRRVLVLGLSYRPDLRESSHSTCPDLVRALLEAGAEVRVHDDRFGPAGVAEHGLPWGEVGDGWAEALVLHTAHAPYLRLTPAEVTGVRAVIDGRQALRRQVWEDAGVAFAGVGR
jgi:nucleotide sugar dehydrogenase